MSIEFIIIGFLVGGLVGLTGVGGASLLTPFLIFFGIQPVIAIGTDFAYNTITKLFGSIQHIKQRTVNFQLLKYLAIGSIPGGVIANIIFFFFLSEYYNEKIILFLLGSILIVVSTITLTQLIFVKDIGNHWKNKSSKEKRNITILSGLIIGAVVGITSVGAGSLFALFILYFYNLKSSEVVGTDVVHAFFLVLFTGILMAIYGHIDYYLTINLLCGSIPGAIIGSKLTKRVPSFFLRILIVIIIFVSGVKLFMHIW